MATVNVCRWVVVLALLGNLALSFVLVQNDERSPDYAAMAPSVAKRAPGLDTHAFPMRFGKRQSGLDSNAFRMNFGKRSVEEADDYPDFRDKRMDHRQFKLSFGR